MRYKIVFEESHKQWMVIDSNNPDMDHGYFYRKADAQRVAKMLNHYNALTA